MNHSHDIPPRSLDDLLQQIEGQATASHLPKSTSQSDHPRHASSPGIEALLGDLKQHYQRQEEAAIAQQEAAIQAQQIQAEREEQEKQKRQAALKKTRRQRLIPTAQTWLKQLKPNSPEGRWFEDFSCNYESKLEAAIDYLEALESVNHPL